MKWSKEIMFSPYFPIRLNLHCRKYWYCGCSFLYEIPSKGRVHIAVLQPAQEGHAGVSAIYGLC